MGKKKETNTKANQDPNLDPDSSQSTQVGEASNGGQIPGEADTSTEAQNSETGEQTDTKSTEESPKDSEGSEHTEVDKEGKGKTTSRKGVAAKVQTDIESIAKKTFERHPVDALYFTSDLQGFGNPSDAAHHARTLNDKTVFEVKREKNGK